VVQLDTAVDGDFGGAVHHHPMLGAVMMTLQRQRAAGLHADMLDLKPVTDVDALVPAPGTVDAQMFGGLRMALVG
jgi:hypothetical protein